MKDKTRFNITNILLMVISILVSIVGYFYIRDTTHTDSNIRDIKAIVKEIKATQDSSNVSNTAQHLVIFSELNGHIEKVKLIYNKEVKKFMEMAKGNAEDNHQQDLMILENTNRSKENKRRIDMLSLYAPSTDSTFWFYGLK